MIGNPLNYVDLDGLEPSPYQGYYYGGSITVLASTISLTSLNTSASLSFAELQHLGFLAAATNNPSPGGPAGPSTFAPQPAFGGCSVFDSFGSCLKSCAANQVGLSTAAGAGAVVAGAPLIAKPFAGAGASKGTSAASMAFRAAFPQKLPFPVLAPTAAKLGSKTNVLGAVLGRYTPIVGGFLLAKDAFAIGGCVGNSFSPSRPR